MYAKSAPNDVYHLLAADSEHTLCGLSVAPIVIDRPAKTQALHLTTKRPSGVDLCKDCARISKAEDK